jgi:hypothetical protein
MVPEFITPPALYACVCTTRKPAINDIQYASGSFSIFFTRKKLAIIIAASNTNRTERELVDENVADVCIAVTTLARNPEYE